ncbi:MAG: LCP family protein [Clostridium sp.]|nr:LCP family protein [Clostridium sp.]MCM1547237.1 LCP family protein [Ruminococcus sp.]
MANKSRPGPKNNTGQGVKNKPSQSSAVRSKPKNTSPAKANTNKNVKKKKGDTGLQEKIIIAVSIIVGLIIIAVMVLNVPFIEMTKMDKDGSTYTEYVSLLEWIKSSQPMADKEGLLSRDPNSYELASEAEKVDDKRDFTNDQIIEGQFTVLCLGFDESRELSDVIMLFLFDIAEDKINILQIPRDCFVPDYTSNETAKLNSVYMNGDEDLIPIQRVVDAVRDTFGIPIDRYITTGCDDIVDMVDIIGGIPIDLPEDVFYSYDKILYAGEQVLNGEQAELFVRARKGYIEGDIGRVKAQRLFLAAAMEKALDMGTIELTKFLTEVYNKKYIGTDLTLQEMSILADFGSSIDLEDVTVHMVPGEGVTNGYNNYDVYSIHKEATVDLLNKYFRPYQTDIGYDDLPITELVESDYYSTDVYDDTQDTLQEIADGATPGESKKTTEEPSDEYDDEQWGNESNW